MSSKSRLLAGLFVAAGSLGFSSLIQAFTISPPVREMPASGEFIANLPLQTNPIPSVAPADQALAAANAPSVVETPRSLLAAFAMKLRNVPYRRGGHEPSTGFDCSGFVRYVYQHTVGVVLPTDAPGQYQTGEKVGPTEMKTGDLVFFRIRGKQISHVGIYLDNGRFIHSPSPGKSVRVDQLDGPYWAKRFAGAKRLEKNL